jgi:hypothetical protein
VNICAALASAAFTKIRGAYSSVSAKPRNSPTSNFQCVLLPTMLLRITRIPAFSMRCTKSRNASVQVGRLSRVVALSSIVLSILWTTPSGSVDTVVLLTKLSSSALSEIK